MQINLKIVLLSGLLLGANCVAVDMAQAQTPQKKVKPAAKAQKAGQEDCRSTA